jgi:hypothetical protein
MSNPAVFSRFLAGIYSLTSGEGVFQAGTAIHNLSLIISAP